MIAAGIPVTIKCQIRGAQHGVYSGAPDCARLWLPAMGAEQSRGSPSPPPPSSPASSVVSFGEQCLNWYARTSSTPIASRADRFICLSPHAAEVDHRGRQQDFCSKACEDSVMDCGTDQLGCVVRKLVELVHSALHPLTRSYPSRL
jgi:hypothetical protein